MNTDWIYSFVDLCLISFIPLVIVALAGMFSEKGGVTNIALEGIMIFGGFFGVLVMDYMAMGFGVSIDDMKTASTIITNVWVKVLIYGVSLLSAMIAGFAFSLLHSFAALHLKADQIITGTALNIIGPALCLLLASSYGFAGKTGMAKLILDNNLFLITSTPGLGSIPVIGKLFFQNTYPSFFIGIIVIMIAPIVLNLTRFGLRLKAVGENPYAAAASGIAVNRYRFIGTSISGVLAGMAGFFFASTISKEFSADVAGFGFLGLAVMIFGNWKPSLIPLAALLFSFFQTLGSGISLIPGGSSLSSYGPLFSMVPYVATILVLMAFSKHNRAPKYDGIPYSEEV